jgi:hypothetical protein
MLACVPTFWPDWLNVILSPLPDMIVTPPVLRYVSEMTIDGEAQSAAAEAVLARLEKGLGSFGFRWLIACAAFPALRLPITLHLGAALKRADGVDPPTEEEALALAALPWFRQGWMDQDWRMALLARQSVADSAVTRAALAELAHAALDAAQADSSGGVTVARVGPAPNNFAPDWGAWRAGLPSALAERDPVFTRLLAPDVRPSRRALLALGGSLALGAAGLVAGPWLRGRLRPSILPQPVTPSSVVLSAIDPTGQHVALALADGRVTRARSDGTGIVESFGTVNVAGANAAWRGLSLGAGPAATMVSATTSGLFNWCESCAAATQVVGPELPVEAQIVQAAISPAARAAALLVNEPGELGWTLVYWEQNAAPKAVERAIATNLDTRLGIGLTGLFAVLVEQGSIRLIQLHATETIIPPNLQSRVSSEFKGAPETSLAALTVGDDRLGPPVVVAAFPNGALWVGTPGERVDLINPAIGPISSLCVEKRPQVVAPVFAAGAQDGRIAVQSPDRLLLHGHRAAIRDLRYSTDFTMLASGSDDGTARIWRLADGTSLELPTGAPVLKVAWTGDQQSVVTLSADGAVRTWPAGGWSTKK